MEEKAVKSRFKRVCVFCGSSTGKRNCYRDAALELGQELVSINNTSIVQFILILLIINIFFSFCFWSWPMLLVLVGISILFLSSASRPLCWWPVFLYEGLKEVGSCLRRRKYWVDGFGFSGGPPWWWTCSRVQSLVNSQILIDFWLYLISLLYIFLWYHGFPFGWFYPQNHPQNSDVQRGL